MDKFFRIGDKVKCIEQKGSLKNGEIYEVKEYKLSTKYTPPKPVGFWQEQNREWALFRRFELFEAAPEKEYEIEEGEELGYKPGFFKGDITQRKYQSKVYCRICEDQDKAAQGFGYKEESTDFVFTEQLNDDPSSAYEAGHINGFVDLMNGEEFELYKCSYCGEEGHNRRTCPEIGPTEIQAGDFVTISGLKKDFEQYKTNEHYKPYLNKTFKVKEVNENFVITEGKDSLGETFGVDTLSFSKAVWSFNSEKNESEEVERMSVWELTEALIPHSRLILLHGPPGTGKTTAANFVADKDGSSPQGVCNITLTEETPAAELRGHFVPRGGEFVWMDGPALTAFKKGYRLVLNEIDKASGDALTFCHALLDDPGIARITLPYQDEIGEPVTIFPHENFHVIATMNGEPEDLPDALRDRFAVRIHIDQVHPDAVKALPKDLHKIAKKGISGDQSRSVSVRGWKAFATLRDLVGEHSAAVAVFGDRADTILNTIKISRSSGAKKA